MLCLEPPQFVTGPGPVTDGTGPGLGSLADEVAASAVHAVHQPAEGSPAGRGHFIRSVGLVQLPLELSTVPSPFPRKEVRTKPGQFSHRRPGLLPRARSPREARARRGARHGYSAAMTGVPK